MGIFAALLSAVFSTSKDIVSKKLTVKIDGTASTFASFAFALPFYAVVLALLWLLGYDLLNFSMAFWWLVLARALTDVFAEWMKMYSFAHGDISLVTLVFSLSPLCLLIMAPILLPEEDQISTGGTVAVALVVAGSAALVYRPSHPDWAKQRKAISLAIGASIFFALNTVFDSQAMKHQKPDPAAAVMGGFTMTALSAVMLLPLVLNHKARQAGLLLSLRGLLARGALETAFMVCKLFAIQYVEAAYVVGLQRTSLLLSILAGRFLFKEGDFKRRLAAGLVILLGVAWIVWEKANKPRPQTDSHSSTRSPSRLSHGTMAEHQRMRLHGAPFMPDKELLAGAAAAVITPNLGVSVCGSMQDRRAEHLHDDLCARALVLDNGDAKIALVVLDLFAAKKEWLGEVKHLIAGFTKIPMSNILISCTHTHSAVATVDIFQSNADTHYLKWAAARIGDCVRTAVQRLAPARIGWAVGREDRAVFNRRFFMADGTTNARPFPGEGSDKVRMNPGEENKAIVRAAGPIDPDVAVLAVQKRRDPDGQPLAVFASYALHYVGRNPGEDISADYFGAACDMLHDKLGGPRRDARQPFVGILANACFGDINNIDVRRRLQQPYEYHQIHSVADIVSSAIAETYRRIRFRDWAALAVAERMVDVAVRRPAAAEVAAAREIVQRAPQGPLRDLTEIYARETVQLAQWPASFRTPVQAIRIGDMAIAALPGEPFCQTGLNIKAKSPFKMTMMVGLANDYAGYLPTEEAHGLGGYETWRAKSSFLETRAATMIQDAALGVLRAAAK